MDCSETVREMKMKRKKMTEAVSETDQCQWFQSLSAFFPG